MVATHPPWSTAMSTITEPSFICDTISLVTSTGARAPVSSTAPTSRSARRRAVQGGDGDRGRPETSDPGRERPLDLQHQLGASPDVVHRGELGADPRVLLAPDPASAAGATLDEHPVSSLDQRPCPGRRE